MWKYKRDAGATKEIFNLTSWKKSGNGMTKKSKTTKKETSVYKTQHWKLKTEHHLF